MRLKTKLSGGDVDIIFSDILYNNLKKKFEGFKEYRNLFTNTDENKNKLIANIEERIKKIIEVNIKNEEHKLENLNKERTTELNIKDGIWLIELNNVKEEINFFNNLINNLEKDKDDIKSIEYNNNTHNSLIKKYILVPEHYLQYEDLIDIIKFEEGKSIKFINGIKELNKNNRLDTIKIKINNKIIKIKDSDKKRYITYNNETIVL